MKRKMRNKKAELFAAVKYFVCFALILSLTPILTACGGNVMMDDTTIDISDIISASASPSVSPANTPANNPSGNTPPRNITPKTSTCTYCGGKGTRDCLTCGGKGTVTNRVTVPNYPGSTSPRTTTTETKPCPNALCSRGQVSCTFCGGDGQR